MSDTAIVVDKLSKRYLLGQQRPKGHGIQHVVEDAIRAPFRMLKHGAKANGSGKSEFWALREVSFEVKRGDVVGVVGRNGAGKSTLLKLLSRITEPTTGRIELEGRVASLLEVGTGFHPELTGRENIFLNGAILGMSRVEIKRKFDEIVAFSEVEKFLDTPVKRYSSGMYVRLAFAVAAHLEPEILIVDEVLAVGDATFQKKCLGKMQELSAGGERTVLFVSHNMAAVQQLTKSCIYLAGGNVVAQGDTTSVLRVYNDAVAPVSDGVYHAGRSPFRRLHGDRRVWFNELRLLNAPNGVIDFADSLTFAADIQAEAEVKNFRVGLTIFRNDGTPVGNTFSPLKESIAAGERKTLTVRLPIPSLSPGKYFCGVSLGRGGHGEALIDYDIVMDVLYFEVATRQEETSIANQWNDNWGSIVFPPPVVVEGLRA